MNKNKILKKVEYIVKKKFEREGSGHDWWHIYRTRKIARQIAKHEKADLFIVELGALLHDIADFKFHGGNENVGPKVAKQILRSVGAEPSIIENIAEIVKNVSFKGAGVRTAMKTLEGKIVQDADRLEAIGAIGIARTFTFGGWEKRLIYDPGAKIRKHKTFKDYKKAPAASTINHFYEKILLLKNRMNTKTGEKLAVQRHKFIEDYLKEFFAEWNGKK